MTPQALQTDALTRPDALLFDLDGVIADVSRSYRQAIIAAAASFGVRVTPSDVAAEKAAGDANNDWVVTQRLLRRRGQDLPLDRVKERFEAAYQGTPERPGLWRKETLLVSPDQLQRLAQRLPLAIVTGRPCHDAERFLAETQIACFFGAMICMEDAPPKPDPTPVRLALQQIQATHAWLVGDTPDDMRAARAAGVLPFGIVSRGDAVDQTGAQRMTSALLEAGAERVIDTLTELEDLLAT